MQNKLTVPFPNVLSDLDSCVAVICLDLVRAGAVVIPGERVLEAKIEQFKGTLGPLARRDVTGT